MFILNENVQLLITISLKFVPKGSVNSIPALIKDNGLVPAFMRNSALII